MDHPGFDALLTRLLRHRGVDVPRLASVSGIPEVELRSMVSGVPPLAGQLNGIARALNFHPADLYVIADVPVPEGLPLRNSAAESQVASLVQIAMALPFELRTQVHRLVDHFPHEVVDRPAKQPRTYDQQQAGFGAMLVTMLCGNRNLNSPRPGSWPN